MEVEQEETEKTLEEGEGLLQVVEEEGMMVGLHLNCSSFHFLFQVFK